MTGPWPRILFIAGLAGMLVGAIDPLEGSLLILAGVGLVGVGAHLGRSRHRALVYCAFSLVALGVGLLWGMSALGGIGGTTGRSLWWGLVLLPYPVGWLMGVVGASRGLAEAFKRPADRPDDVAK